MGVELNGSRQVPLPGDMDYLREGELPVYEDIMVPGHGPGPLGREVGGPR